MGGRARDEHDESVSARSTLATGCLGLQTQDRHILSIADKHHIHPIFVLFDSCWEAAPKLGPQHPPIPGVTIPGGSRGRGCRRLRTLRNTRASETMYATVVGAFGKDKRIVAWDLWNEPANTPEVIALQPQVFAWAREAHPSQPLTSGVYQEKFAPNGADKMHGAVTEIQLALQMYCHSTITVGRRCSRPMCWGSSNMDDPLSALNSWRVGRGARLIRSSYSQEASRCGDQLGVRGGEDSDQSALGLLAAPLRLRPAGGVAP